jgi:hypothetical protein
MALPGGAGGKPSNSWLYGVRVERPDRKHCNLGPEANKNYRTKRAASKTVGLVSVRKWFVPRSSAARR